MARWSEAPETREQAVLFPVRLDDAIEESHSVRLFDEILGRFDWSAWEMGYDPHMGRPAIPPRVLASVILYGFLTRLRSSRKLAEALEMRLDFRWLVEGRRIDHTTISEFRRKHQGQLKILFADVLQLAQRMGFLNLRRVGYDATRVRANNRRSGTRTPEELLKERDELVQKFEELNQQAEQEDAQDEELFGSDSAEKLPADLRNKNTRSDKLNAAIKELERTRQQGGTVPKRIPITDLESRVMPNKDGGHAPNYTPLATVDIDSGLIVQQDVLNVINEDGHLMAALTEVQEQFNLPRPPDVLTDGMNGTGANLAECAERGVTIYSPCEVADPTTNPALREDPTQPVPESEWNRLPEQKQRIQGKLQQQIAKSAFVFDEANNCYWCPAGKALKYANVTSEPTARGRRIRQRYTAQASDCSGCPLKARCVMGKAKFRQINREQYEAHRERHARHMAKPESKEIYALRRHPGERPFAEIKQRFGMRSFLLRGLEKVKTEWTWGTIAFNLDRVMSLIRCRAGPGGNPLTFLSIPP